MSRRVASWDNNTDDRSLLRVGSSDSIRRSISDGCRRIKPLKVHASEEDTCLRWTEPSFRGKSVSARRLLRNNYAEDEAEQPSAFQDLTDALEVLSTQVLDGLECYSSASSKARSESWWWSTAMRQHH